MFTVEMDATVVVNLKFHYLFALSTERMAVALVSVAVIVRILLA